MSVLSRLGRGSQKYIPKSIYGFIRNLWILYQGLDLFLINLAGGVPFHSFRRFVYRYFFDVHIGRGSVIHWKTRFFEPAGIKIGEYCNIGNNAFLDGRRGLTIGNRVATGAEVMVYTLQHDIDNSSFAVTGGPVIIDDYVYVGPRVIILPDVHIGYGAVVGAGAVVAKDVPPFAVVGGVPAQFIRERNHDLDYRPDFQMPFQ